ncbi:O-methyltransferase-domain-containing protein [Aspergillus pseudoustus]|uniref:O-methyltransferase-domain-containing protein n=1 Tax=Aspergillus pseudoustus TaxID=1810923 RepID=A0ABR4KD85_9EURO
MAESANILALAMQITGAAQVISDFTSTNNVTLSFDPRDPGPTTLSGPGAQAYNEARMAALDASSKLSALIMGNRAHHISLCSQVQIPPPSRSRYLIGGSYLLAARQIPPRRTHAPLARDALTRGHRRDRGTRLPRSIPLQLPHHRCAVKWGSSAEYDQAGFNFAEDTELGMYEFSDRDKEAQGTLSTMLKCNVSASTELIATDVLFHGFDWEALGRGVVVDVTGSIGHVSIQLARRIRKLHFIVQDFESVCQRGESLLHDDLRDRIRFQAKNFFDEQEKIPHQRAVYFFRGILYNWSDKYACRILRAVIPALKPGDRIVLCDQVLAQPGTVSPSVEREMRFMDMTMLSNFNGQERTAAQFESLVASAHSGLKIVQMTVPAAHATGLIDISFER